MGGYLRKVAGLASEEPGLAAGLFVLKLSIVRLDDPLD
jgi:hypothetical protein